METRIVLVKPPETSRFNFGAFSLGVLAAAIRHLGVVSILDATTMPMEEAVRSVWACSPDLIGVTVMGLSSAGPAAEFIHRLRSWRNVGEGTSKRVTILAGGHGASMLPASLLAAGADGVAIGEGELTLQQILVNGMSPGTPGVACLMSGQMVMGPMRAPIRPLGRLSPPARDLMPSPPGGVHLMETSRGCPHDCSFCETTRFYGRSWRAYSPARVAAEVRRLVVDYDAWMIHFADDNFAASPRRVLQICEKLQHGHLPALIFASARADDLVAHPDLIPAMAAVRILRITVGVETVEPEMGEATCKPIPLEIYQKAFGRMREHGMFSVASFIVGLSGEKPEMRERAVEMAVKAGPDSAHFLPFLPLPGVPLASGRNGYDPDPIDVQDARLFTQGFNRHPVVRARLAAAANGGGVRGLLARATLERLGDE